jgi:hypothetical protein
MRDDLLSFIEWPSFHREWRQLGLTDEDLWELQDSILEIPLAGKLVAGTGGLRKLRFAPARAKRGKSGALRVCYVCFLRHGIVYLITVYAKGEKDDISPNERKSIKRLIEGLESRIDRSARKR